MAAAHATPIAAVRQRIEAGLAARPPAADPAGRLLRNVVGPISPELEAALAAPSREAAVLIALIERSGGYRVLFTERSPDLRHHPGQISFPGGRLDHPGEGPVAAALREAEEEVGLAAAEVAVAGCLDPHVTGTGFRVTPVIGFVADAFEPVPDPLEVRAVFEVPLDFLLVPDNARATILPRLGTQFRTWEFVYEGQRIWGATAAMLISFRELLAGRSG